MAKSSKKDVEPMEMGPTTPPENEKSGTMKKGQARDGAKMKKPMDGEPCNCGKGKKICDGSCKDNQDSECSMKKRGDALAAPEYLSACELGIENRSRTYIRARLDATGTGKKCGGGWTSQKNQCRQGPGAQSSPSSSTQSSSGGSKVRSALESTASVAGRLGTYASYGLAAKGIFSGNPQAITRGFAGLGASQALTGAGELSRAKRTGNNYKAGIAKAKINAGLITLGINSYMSGDLSPKTLSNIQQGSRRTMQNIMGRTSAKKANFTMKKQKQQVWRGYKRSLLDSVYSPGFSVDYDQLAVR